MREQSPGAPAPNHMKYGGEDLAYRMEPWAAEAVRWREVGLETIEFAVSQIGQVMAPRWQTPATLPAKLADVPVFQTVFSV